MSDFEYGQRVICHTTQGDVAGIIEKLQRDCELVRTQTGELRMFHRQNIVDLKEFEKGKRGKS